MGTLEQLQEINWKRAKELPDYDIKSPLYYAVATAGEVGELCNLVKKWYRGTEFDRDGVTPIDSKLLGKEAADIVIYLELFCNEIGIDLNKAIADKFNEDSDRVRSYIKLDIPKS